MTESDPKQSSQGDRHLDILLVAGFHRIATLAVQPGKARGMAPQLGHQSWPLFIGSEHGHFGRD
jgi:hypothetical protein